jgi:uncharacterized protein (TIGR02266 family)
MGVASLVLINEENGFDEENMQFFSSFANLASIAMEMSDLPEGGHKGKSLRVPNERSTENILDRLPSSAEKERQRADDATVKIKAEQKAEEKRIIGGPNKEKIAWAPGTISLEKESQRSDVLIVKISPEEKLKEHKIIGGANKEKIAWAPGTISLKEEAGIDRRREERVETTVRAEFQEEYWGYTKNLSNGGAFILTSSPLDLGDEILLKLHIPDGGEQIEVDCKVVWTNQYGGENQDLRRGMGVKFLNLQPEVQKRIQTYIECEKNRELRLER